jgi:hypothetical protein
MKNNIYFLIILFLLIVTPLISAKNIEVLIEYKPTQQISKIQTFSIQSTPQLKYEIKTISEEKFEELKKDQSIFIQENIPKHILLDISVPLIEADTTWNIQQNLTNITGENQTICILDTGAQTTHPALTGKNATCNIDCATAACIENCSKTDPHGHGTHVAGIIVSTDSIYHGVTQNTKYIPVMVCDATGDCPNQAVLDGLDWCITNKDNYNISVISMSLGTDLSYSSYCDASFTSDTTRINNAVANNISVVTSTGNSNLAQTNVTYGISSPACIQNSTRVGNTDDSDNMAVSGFRHQFFSDIITAPGGNIISTYPTNTYASSSGTSMSTPHVSGIITLLNHYKKLESNKILTPTEIKQYILDSGKTIYDSETNQNYTRINAYQTILFSDEQIPNITYMFPTNNSLTNPMDTNFTCNATDNLQFANLTINLYNLTSLIYNESTNSESLTVNYTLTEGNYNWSCIAIDNQSNTKTITAYLIASYIQTEILSPENNTHTNQNQITINCSAQSTNELSNITFNIYNSTSLLNSTPFNLTSLSNNSIFNYNLTNEIQYFYNCLSINNESEESQTQNYTITYDITAPKITLNSPINNSRITSPTTFTYSEIELNKNFCNITINNQNYSSFTQTLSNGFYNWSIYCTDLANNTNMSQIFQLEIYTEETSSGGGESSSTLTTTPKIYPITETQIKQGIQQKLKKEESINFKIKSQTHKLILNKIDTDKIEITLQSEPINLTVYINSPLKLNLNNDETFDLELILTSIENNQANIFIKEINETIPTKHILPTINETENKSQEIKLLEENNNLIKRIIDILKLILRFFKIKI